jgi:abortive infection bacteriophage resistance protein
MTKRRTPYLKKATTYKEQIRILRGYGVIISDECKACEYLSDIGYYRLGFYLHPFEVTYPSLDQSRSHHVRSNTRIEDAVALYYFDFDLRNILNKYLSRIEVAIRTAFIYELSNQYADNPTWFVDTSVVNESFVDNFDDVAYDSIKKKPSIRRHHSKYLGPYAPAWKTMEYMTFGNLEMLYGSLLRDSDKRLVSLRFGEPAISSFKSYLSAIREVRNSCAHGNFLFGMTLKFGIRTGVACESFSGKSNQTFQGALKIIDYMLAQVSVNRRKDMWSEIYDAVRHLYDRAPLTRRLIEEQTGILLSE